MATEMSRRSGREKYNLDDLTEQPIQKSTNIIAFSPSLALGHQADVKLRPIGTSVVRCDAWSIAFEADVLLATETPVDWSTFTCRLCREMELLGRRKKEILGSMGNLFQVYILRSVISNCGRPVSLKTNCVYSWINRLRNLLSRFARADVASAIYNTWHFDV